MPHRQKLPLTAEQQAQLTPDQVLQDLLEGNKRYVADTPTQSKLSDRRHASANGQFPKAVILSCLDSRIPVETVFDQSIGDLFVGRNAGNVVNADQLGSMEFATKISGAKLVIVLGHEACGAVKGACDGAELGNLTQLLEKIQPAVDTLESFPAEERSSAHAGFVAAAVTANIHHQVAQIRNHSSVLADLEKDGAINIVGAHYALESGEVTML